LVRSESPDTRILIGDADILFLPAASQDSLVGTLFLSTYPMFILGQEWLTRDSDGSLGENGRHLVFPGASLQGVFNVTQVLLAEIGAGAQVQKGDSLYGYRQLTSSPASAEHPGLWLLTLTHDGFLPVDWLSVSTKNWFATLPQPRSGSSATTPNTDPPLEKR